MNPPLILNLTLFAIHEQTLRPCFDTDIVGKKYRVEEGWSTQEESHSGAAAQRLKFTLLSHCSDVHETVVTIATGIVA